MGFTIQDERGLACKLNIFHIFVKALPLSKLKRPNRRCCSRRA